MMSHRPVNEQTQLNFELNKGEQSSFVIIPNAQQATSLGNPAFFHRALLGILDEKCQ